MTLRRLVLVRHGQTDFNVEGRMQGHRESELTSLGLAQARAAAPLLVRYKAVRLLSSDLSRAARTAEEIGSAVDLPVQLDARLRETDLGKWQGLTPSEVEADWPGALERWQSDANWGPPGGESRVEVAARVVPVIDELEAELAGSEPSTVIACAHGGVIAALCCALLGLDTAHWMALGGLDNAHWAILRRRSLAGGNWRLTGFDVGQLD